MDSDGYPKGIYLIPIDNRLRRFEYDAGKNTANEAKHGVTFEEARRIWDDPDYLRIPAKKKGEKRFMALGMVDGRCLAAVATERGDAIRIISARRASEKEAKRYGDA
ncbi:BrnT family toxin [Gordonibacter massiliensis (ex Traore et al. 2017)]|uniref:BrnT family toxin n=1 Tax=Gordonibacter massiliensis (ex Traore et al. 2017) TaxID=1841863 RepID=UPI001C8C8E30|nr:BrnT family toxin [Gordonibacter massiliensis (ex Traore et al. 2017)]MBX9034179.1 BrnT family toxin [Gordonibacter massiliensis (ex Traore et al. 2017)]